MNRSRSRVNAAEVATPRCIMYLGHRCRPAHGREGLALQGVHFGDMDHLLAEYHSDFLLNLSGNAFHTIVCGAAVLVKEGLLGEIHMRIRRRSSACSAAL
eukprot:9466279-Pyramimonas_sp.AAC.1